MKTDIKRYTPHIDMSIAIFQECVQTFWELFVGMSMGHDDLRPNLQASSPSASGISATSGGEGFNRVMAWPPVFLEFFGRRFFGANMF